MRRPGEKPLLAALGAASVIALAGCGDDDDYANQLRPATPITVTASISNARVTVSPNRFGAGPITLVVANLTDSSQELVLESDDAIGTPRPGLRQQTGTINPSDTASLRANLPRGRYELRVAAESIAPGQITVGRARPSAQDELLRP